jgi:hypothetical protein
MPFRGCLEPSDKAVSVEGLRQVANRPGRKRSCAYLLIGERGEKNERNTVTLSAQVILQLDAAHTGHLDIRNYTREVLEALRSQELLGGRECMYDISERPHEAVGGGAYGFIIINDCDKF